jgi:hypothetical protein
MLQCYNCGILVEPQHVYRRSVQSATTSSGQSVSTMENLCPHCGQDHDAWGAAWWHALFVAVAVGGVAYLLVSLSKSNLLAGVAWPAIGVSWLVTFVVSYYRGRPRSRQSFTCVNCRQTIREPHHGALKTTGVRCCFCQAANHAP